MLGLTVLIFCRVQIDNPFAVNGELRRKADYILRHSRISRADLHIVDPDTFSTPGQKEQDLPRAEEDTIRLQEVSSKNIKREDTVAGEKTTLDRWETAQKNDRPTSEVVNPTRYHFETMNSSDQPKHVPETGTILENRTLNDSNHDSQIQSKCDALVTDTVCIRKSYPVTVIDSVTVATSPECQQAEHVKLTRGKFKCCNVQ